MRIVWKYTEVGSVKARSLVLGDDAANLPVVWTPPSWGVVVDRVAAARARVQKLFVRGSISLSGQFTVTKYFASASELADWSAAHPFAFEGLGELRLEFPTTTLVAARAAVFAGEPMNVASVSMQITYHYAAEEFV